MDGQRGALSQVRMRGQEAGGCICRVVMTESRDISCVDKETGIEIFEGERLGRNRGLQHGGVGGDSLTREIQ